MHRGRNGPLSHSSEHRYQAPLVAHTLSAKHSDIQLAVPIIHSLIPTEHPFIWSLHSENNTAGALLFRDTEKKERGTSHSFHSGNRKTGLIN